jgi:serine/threonine protein kinase
MDDYFPNSNANGRSHQTKLKKSNKDNKSSPVENKGSQL